MCCNKFKGEIPEHFADLGVKLTTWHLYFNDWVGTIPKKIGLLRGLNSFVLWGGFSLSGTIPTEIGNLENLQKLVLHGTAMSGELPKEMAKLVHLDYIYIQGEFNGTIPAFIGNFPKLSSLYLANSRFQGTIPASLTTLPLGLLYLTVCSLVILCLRMFREID